ncbi:uncharacterized protein PFL1_05698 [Pseudozyma flocculosa PF-1]|uniref:ferric-chelate reductase (NADPH) n=2 Tax=Pseudozyma flocculosa TaxID=84751 RepID=A0A5C3FC33_9BASI|nr:uncharacterized protein PFL1_05698 [Pseudozyma flocculosa PF-1]EPQ26719.1 hypothetical protein PFL1_05698 [Pseudozyma flocculosa PF-1]SPO40959.1 related to ferric reductase FRE2 precursor [Pseudozyma flocculosa]
MTDAGQLIVARHIQNMSEATSLEPHWGYVDRALPCTSDAGSCAYLDVVYHSHDLGMLYSGILWATLGGILFLWTILRRVGTRSDVPYDDAVSPDDEAQTESTQPKGLGRWTSTLGAAARRHLLPETWGRKILGRTTRLQLLILAVFAGYLLIWSLAGIAYHTWVTPVKRLPGVYNIRTSLGPWADRVGTLAFALTPFSILLSSRESLLSLLTGIPYHHFNFLHRWLGHIIFIQASLHTVGWCIVEIRLYQPQPSVAAEWIVQRYMVWGIVAMALLLLLWVLSLPISIRFTGYEFFRKAHYVLAMLYIGACIGHWKQLQVFLIPALSIWFVDRALRLVRTALLHYNYLDAADGRSRTGFAPARAEVTRFEDAEHGDILRLDFDYPHQPWKVGQHFYLCFPDSSIWQSHPFTPMSCPQKGRDDGGMTRHTYLIRAKKGETRKLADLVAGRTAPTAGSRIGSSTDEKSTVVTSSVQTPVILTGPYGESIVDGLTLGSLDNVLCVAGGTGITFVLPVLLHLGRQRLLGAGRKRDFELIWIVRRAEDIKWCRPELEELQSFKRVRVRIFVTRQHRVFPSSRVETGLEDEEEVLTKPISPSPSIQSDLETPLDASDEKRCLSEPSSASRTATTNAPRIEYSTGAAPDQRHPDLGRLVRAFIEGTSAGRTKVFASGPGGMVSDLRKVVASSNDAGKVWRGEQKFDVDLISDNRLEW